MKNINHFSKEAFRFMKGLLLIILFCSFTPCNTFLTSCQHDFDLRDNYSVNRPETVIIKALKEYGFDVKRGIERLDEVNLENHTWRLLNVRTKYGMIKEITIQIRGGGTEILASTRVSLVKICLNEEFTQKELNLKIKKYRTFFKKEIVGKLKKYKG